MPDVSSSTALPWDDASAAIVLASAELPWRDGDLVISTGGPFTPFDPPEGSTPTEPRTEPLFVIPAQPSYEQVHTVAVTDLRDLSALELESLSIAYDDGSVCWTFSGQGGADLFVRMTTIEEVPTIRVAIDGLEWDFLIEGVRRSREHGKVSVQLTGRSVTMLAAAPYQFERNWVNEGPASAAQLIDQAQADTGLVLQWLLDDWLVPDRVWSYTGTPMAVAQRVADAVGAVVLSDRKEMMISVLPRYTWLPNEWPTVVPDVEIAIDAAAVESYERADRPGYDGVYVAGQQQGFVGYVRLAGTAGAATAPMVTDPLITEEPAARQRGAAILGAGGPQARMELTLPVLTGAGEPGVLDPGMLCHVIDGTAGWYGVVRSVRVAVQLPSVRQTVALERHTGCISGSYTEE